MFANGLQPAFYFSEKKSKYYFGETAMATCPMSSRVREQLLEEDLNQAHKDLLTSPSGSVSRSNIPCGRARTRGDKHCDNPRTMCLGFRGLGFRV